MFNSRDYPAEKEYNMSTVEQNKVAIANYLASRQRHRNSLSIPKLVRQLQESGVSISIDDAEEVFSQFEKDNAGKLNTKDHAFTWKRNLKDYGKQLASSTDYMPDRREKSTKSVATITIRKGDISIEAVNVGQALELLKKM